MGTVNAVFTVTQSIASAQTVTVNYATADGTAVAPADYVTNMGLLTFNPGGALTQTVTVVVNGDVIDEGTSETFTVALSTPTNATIGDGSATGTITDDDGIVIVPSASIADVTVTEGDAGTVDAVFTVTLFPMSGQTVTVDYATADGTAAAPGDYTAATGTLTFDPGVTTRDVTVLVQGDVVNEGASETFTVGLSMPTNAAIGDGSATGTITDDDGGGTCTDLGPIVPGTVSVGTALEAGDCEFAAQLYYDRWTLSMASQSTIQIDLASSDSDAVMRLEDANGMLLGADDDSGGGPDGHNSRIVATLSAGTYFILASSFGAGETGGYTLGVDLWTPVSSPLISNLSVGLVQLSSPACVNGGSLLNVGFDFTDADGDVDASSLVGAAFLFQGADSQSKCNTPACRLL